MKNIIDRALKTFVEGFVSALVVTLPKIDWNNVFGTDTGYRLLISALIGCIATAISLVWNGVVDPALKGDETAKLMGKSEPILDDDDEDF